MKRFLFTLVAIAGILFLAGCPNVQIPDDDTSEETAGIYTLTVATTGTGTVTPDPDKAKYNEGEVVTLTAAAGTDFIFDSWSGDASGAGGSVSVTMDGDKSVTALFKQLFGVSITIDGPGSVTVDPSKSEYIDGEEISLTAVPDTGKAFFRWTGDVDGYCHPTRTAAVTGDMAVTAAFMDSGVYYVRTGESGDGSLDSPWGSIQDAIDNVPTPSAVFVSAGTYNESISAREGVSLYGGFNADFSDRKYQTSTDRENASYQTLIANPSSNGEGTNIEPVAAVHFDGSSTAITTDTIIEGFTIHSGIGHSDAAIRCKDDGSPLIRYNTITGIGDGTNTYYSYGIFSRGSSPVISYNNIRGNSTDTFRAYGINCGQVSDNMKIDHNIIHGGDNTTATEGGQGIGIVDSSGAKPIIEYNTITGGYNNVGQSIGINDTISASILRYNTILAGSSIDSSNADTYGINVNYSTVHNNIIHGGRATSSGSTGTSIGVLTGAGSCDIYNNTICGGSGSHRTRAINIYSGNAASFVNNIIFNESDAVGSEGIFAWSGYPGEIKNNNIFDCNVLFQYDTSDSFTTTSGYETFLGTRASGNISIDLIDNGGSYYFADWDGADNDIFTMSDNDWRLTADAPVNVRGGGLDLSVTFTDDYDGTTRTTTSTPTGMTNANYEGWSMGAYEED